MKKLAFSALVITTISIFPLFASAKEVRVPFGPGTCFVENEAGDQVADASWPYRMKNLSLGEECGKVVADFKKGNGTNNFLSKGMRCSVKGILTLGKPNNRNKRKVSCENEERTVRASATTSANGNFNMSFIVLDDGPQYYTVYGPKDSSGNRVGCYVYRFDHLV